MKRNLKRYSQLMQLSTFQQRFNYLKLSGGVGVETFGFDRYMNQDFYKSKEWKKVRNQVIVRDNGFDLGIKGRQITPTKFGKSGIIVHHMNPIDQTDIQGSTQFLLNPQFLICVSQETHKAIHYGTLDKVQNNFVQRAPGDTCPWK